MFWVGNSLGLTATRRAGVAGPVVHSPPRPAGTGTRLSLTWLPPRLGTSPPQRLSLSQEAWPFMLPPRGLLCSSTSSLLPLPQTPRADSLAVPPGQPLEWHLKGAPSSAGCWEGGLEDAEDGSGGSWTQIPAVRGEGFTRLLLIALNADSVLLSQLGPKLRDTNCSWGVWGTLPMLPERLSSSLFSQSSLTRTLSKSETNWEMIRSLERAQRDGEVLLLCSPTLSGEGAKIIRKIHYFSTVCSFCLLKNSAKRQSSVQCRSQDHVISLGYHPQVEKFSGNEPQESPIPV